MSALKRSFLYVAAAFLLGNFAGCSSGSTSGSTPPVTPTAPAVTPKPKFVYTGNQGGTLSGYSADPTTGILTPLSGFPLSVGLNPVFVTHDPQNRFLIVADIAASAVYVFAINGTSGALTDVSPSPYLTQIESGPVIVDPSGTHVYLYRTGSNDGYPGVAGNQLVGYSLGSTGVLSEIPGTPIATGLEAFFSPCTGIVIDPAGKFLYLQDISNVYTFGIAGASGALTLLQTVPSASGGGLALDPAGSYLYAAGSNLLLTYAIDPNTGLLTLAKSSSTAEQSGAYTIAISPNGKFAYTIENNNYLVSYTITGGTLVPVGPVYSGVYGQQIAVDPSGSFVYVPQACSNCPSGLYNVVHEFSIGSTGALTPLSNATVPSGMTPFGITVTTQ